MSISNFLSPVEFGLAIARLPESKFYVQSVNIPGLNANFATNPTPFKDLPLPAAKLEYEDLQVSIIADEDMKGFREISEWITKLHFTESYSQYRELEQSDYGIRSDMTLLILNSNKNPNVKVTFRDVFPISISGIELNTREADVIAPTFDVTFKYDSYYIEV